MLIFNTNKLITQQKNEQHFSNTAVIQLNFAILFHDCNFKYEISNKTAQSVYCSNSDWLKSVRSSK